MSADSGEKLGTVSDLLLDEGGERVIGLVVKHGLFKGEGVLPTSAIQTLGADAVVSRTSTDLVTASEWKARERARKDEPRREDLPREEPITR